MSSESSESLDRIERQLVSLQPKGAPPGLRPAVLDQTRLELRAARWDRLLARAASVLLVVGVTLNLSIGLRSMGSRNANRSVASTRSQSLVETAVVVAEVTDAATGRRFARQIATMAGIELTSAESAAIDAALQREVPQQTRKNGNRG